MAEARAEAIRGENRDSDDGFLDDFGDAYEDAQKANQKVAYYLGESLDHPDDD